MHDERTVAPVQRQLEAYNDKDLAAFLACYHQDVTIYRMPATAPDLSGRDALGDFYATERFNIEALHADVLQRMVVGNKVIDHERVVGLTVEPYEVIVVYQVSDGLIATAWFYPVTE